MSEHAQNQAGLCLNGEALESAHGDTEPVLAVPHLALTQSVSRLRARVRRH